MSDETRWQAPTSSGPAEPGSAPPGFTPPVFASPGFAPPGFTPPGFTPPGFTSPGQASPAGSRPGQQPGAMGGPMGSGWAPPPKPGLIPLRPLSFGTILGAPYQALRRNPRPTFGVSLLVQGLAIMLTLVAVGGATFLGLSRLDSAASQSDQDDILAGTVASALIAALIPIAFSLVASGVMQAVVVLEVARQTLGEKLTFRRLWSMAKGRIWAVGGYTVLVTLVLLVAVGVIVAVIALFVVLGESYIVLGVSVSLLLVLGLLALGIWIATKIAFVPSVMVLERARLGVAIRRSWTLTNGRFWYIFATLLLVAVILNIASSIISAPLQFAVGIAGPLLSPTGDVNTALIVVGVIYLITIIATTIIAAVTIVVQSATTVLLYIDARMRKEGLDLDLVRFVEARQAGDPGARDPFALA